MKLKKARNILLIRIDKIGDLILSTPLIKTLRKEIPEAKLTLLVSLYARQVLENSSLIDELLVWEGRKDLPPEIKEKNWDVAFALSPLTSAYQLAFSSGAGIRTGIVYSDRLLSRIIIKLWLTHPLIIDLRGKLKRGEKLPHEIEQMKALLLNLGIEEFYPEMVVELSGEQEKKAQEKAKRLNQKFPGGILGFQLSERWLVEGWKVSHLAELVQRIRERFPDYFLWLFCAPGEKELGDEFLSQLRNKSGVEFFNNLNFSCWAVKLKQLSVLLSVDSGAVHLASALKIPVVAVYLKRDFSLCSQQWAPWKIPHFKVKMQDFDRSAEEIITDITRLLKERKTGQ